MTPAAAEPLWMKNLRAKARERFEGMKWPVTSEEEWRRTDVSRLGLDTFAPVSSLTPACPREAEPAPGASGHIRFQANKCIEVSLDAKWREAGVRLLPLDNALEEFEAPLHTLYERSISDADNRFLAWHYASLSHGALLWIPPGLEIAEPVFIEFEEDGAGTMSAPHVAVLVGAGSRASVVQRITVRAGGKDAGGKDVGGMLCNAVLDVRLSDAAGLQYCEQQELGPADLFVRHVRAEVGRDSSFRHFDAELGAKWVKARVDCALDGPGAEAFLDGAYYCGAGQHMDLRTVQRHQSPKATSRAVYKGAVSGGGRSIFQGLIEVATGASGTDAWLTNRNLILGEGARSDSVPTLKIGNNDVKCSHGSTTGRLNAEELFYLESRGLSTADAREMLVIGYFEDILTPAPESFKDGALAAIKGRLRVSQPDTLFMNRWVRAASADELVSTLSVTVDGNLVALFRTDEGIFALDDICSHEYSLLSEGDVWAGEVYCQKHGSRFNLRSGAVTGLPATKPVRTWEVKVENGEIWVALHTPS